MSRLDFIHSKRKKVKTKKLTKHQNKVMQSIDTIKTNLSTLVELFKQQDIKCFINYNYITGSYIVTCFKYRMNQKIEPTIDNIRVFTFSKEVIYNTLGDAKASKQRINNRFNQLNSMNKLFIRTLHSYF